MSRFDSHSWQVALPRKATTFSCPFVATATARELEKELEQDLEQDLEKELEKELDDDDSGPATDRKP